MVLTHAGEGRLQDEIAGQLALVRRVAENMAAMDRHLAARQDQLYSGEEAIYREVIGPARQDIANATARSDKWKSEVGKLKKECNDLDSRIARLPPGERGTASERLEDLRREVIMARSRLTSIQDRITDMLDRVLYITERH
jgi:outer membrane murein-binding lipoprotein Lpp